MTDRQDDFDRGEKNRRAMLGDAWVDQALGRTTEFNAEFQGLVTRHAWHDIWGRPDLDAVTRRLLVLGMTMGQARWEEFELHCRASLRAGVPVAKIKETLLQGAIYCGVPAANTAFKIAGRLLDDEGLSLPVAPLTAGVRVATHHTFSAPQLKIALQGQGTPVLLSHALGVDLQVWDGLAATLAAAGCEVARYDHRGHGGSAVPPGPYTLDQLVDDAARVVTEWGRGPVVFVGLSMGGMVAQGLAIRHPLLLRGMVVANSSAQFAAAARTAWAEREAAVAAGGMAAVAEALMERWFTAGFRAAQPAVVQRCRALVLRSDPVGYVAACRAVASLDWLDRLPEVRCPTLVLAGAQDTGTPPAMAQAIAERIAGAALEVFDDAAHLSVLEQPERFARSVLGFIDGHGR